MNCSFVKNVRLRIANSIGNAEDRGYAYDPAWNLNYRTNNGSLQTFTVDGKNQLSSVPGGSCEYDANGNLISDGTWTYTYDDENRLVARSAAAPSNGALASGFAYDGLGRMRTRVEYQGDGSQWVAQSGVKYVYDGRRVIQERDWSDNPSVAYTRGTDLSGSLEAGQ